MKPKEKIQVKQDGVRELMPAFFAVAFVWFTTTLEEALHLELR
jgi:hypothetical protein